MPCYTAIHQTRMWTRPLYSYTVVYSYTALYSGCIVYSYTCYTLYSAIQSPSDRMGRRANKLSRAGGGYRPLVVSQRLMEPNSPVAIAQIVGQHGRIPAQSHGRRRRGAGAEKTGDHPCEALETAPRDYPPHPLPLHIVRNRCRSGRKLPPHFSAFPFPRERKSPRPSTSPFPHFVILMAPPFVCSGTDDHQARQRAPRLLSSGSPVRYACSAQPHAPPPTH